MLRSFWRRQAPTLVCLSLSVGVTPIVSALSTRACGDTKVSEVGGHKRRAVGTGWQIGFGNSMSILF